MKDVQCYELFGGITLKNHAFSFSTCQLFKFDFMEESSSGIARSDRIGPKVPQIKFSLAINST